MCYGRSRARTTITPAYSDAVITAILAIRDTPPARLNRIPGPKTILYYLQQDTSLVGQRLPRSTRTIWSILRQHGRLADPPAREHVPLPRPGPMVRVQLDFKDDGAPVTDPDGKQQHVIETLTALDVGTSSVVASQTREDFQAGTTIEAVAQIVEEHGLPQEVQYDRDPRFIGGTHQREFPSPFTRFWLCLGVTPIINPPHQPQKNAFVERYHRNLKYECLWVYRPKTLDEIRTVVAEYQEWYNHERPSQAITCGNQPPRVAFPNLPALPGPPLVVDPNRWVEVLDGVAYTRRVTQQGAIMLDGWTYYVGLAAAGQEVTAQIDAKSRQIVVYQGTTVLKRAVIKGLVGVPLPFADFVAYNVPSSMSYWSSMLSCEGGGRSREVVMTLLQSKDRFNDVYEVDLATGSYCLHDRHTVTQPLQGFAAILDGSLVALYRHEGQLHVRINGQDLLLDDTTTATLNRARTHQLMLENRSGQALDWEYTPPRIDPPLEHDLSACVEEEDFDFGVFVYNIINQPGRSSRIAVPGQ